MHLALLLLLSTLSVSCQQYSGVLAEQAGGDADVDTRRFNPYKLGFEVGNPYVETLADTDQTVPKIQVMLDEDIPINYYQVLRCHKTVKVLDQDGKDPLQTNYPTYRTVPAHLFAWGRANVNGCIFLGGLHRQKVFTDVTAPSGEFFYLFRPCLSPKRSQFGKRRNCHYLYRKTGLIDYADTFGQKQWQLRLELAAMRSKLQAHFAQLSELIINKANFLEQCESEQARKCVFKARFAGISKLVLTGAAATIGGILSGGTAAVVAGSAAIKLADKVFSSASNCSLQCDSSVFDKRIKELQDGIQPIAEAISLKLEALSAQ